MKLSDVKIGKDINPSSLEGPKNPADAYLKTDVDREALDQQTRMRNQSGISGTRGAENVRIERLHMKKAQLKAEKIKQVRNTFSTLSREGVLNLEISL